MPDFLALDWENQQICGVEAHVSRNSIRVTRCFLLEWPEGVDPAAEPQRAGEWLKQQLAREQVATRPVLVSLPREAAVVRQLELPNAPDEELPDLVLMQAATKSSSSLDSLLLDFLPLPPRADDTGRDVLMTTIAKEKADAIRALTAAAGLELASIGISPVAASELVARVERRRGDDPEQTSLFVARHGNRVEISMLRQPHLVFSHSAQLGGESEQQDNQLLLAEIARSRVALDRLMGGGQFAQAWVLGTADETKSLAKALAARLSCTVGSIDPLNDVDVEIARKTVPAQNHALFAGPVGMLLSRAAPVVETIDFLNPRKPVVKPDTRKRRLGMAAAAVLVVAASAYGGLALHLGGLDDQIDARRQRNKQLDQIINDGGPSMKSAALVGEWDRHNVDWLDQMRELNRTLPGTDRIYLTDFTFDPSSRDVIARVQANGFARQRSDVESLYQKLRDRGYNVHPHEIKFSGDDAGYPVRFNLDLDLTRTKPGGTPKPTTGGAAVANK